jgi:aminoglycoside 3-N-acetyltransferase
MDRATRSSLASDLRRLGLAPGCAVMVHAGLRRLGPVLGGADQVIGALLDAVGPNGTILGYADWESDHEDLLDEAGRVLPAWRDHVRPFDPAASRAIRDNGAFPELLRTTPGARRSGNPGASVVALGARAAALTEDHPLDYGYGPGSPFARLVSERGRVLMLGAPWDTMTLLHQAEHLADLPGKRVRRVEVPFAAPEGVRWRTIEEFDTADPVSPVLPEDFIERIVAAFVAAGHGRQGEVGRAPSLLVEAAEMLPFAVAWMEARALDPAGGGA